MDATSAKARIDVDFHLKVDEDHTLASVDDLDHPVNLAEGDVLIATDGEDARLAVVDAYDVATGVLHLRVLWDRYVAA